MRRGLRLTLEGLGLAATLLFVAAVAYLPHADTFTQPPDETKPQLVRLGLAYWDWLVTGTRDDYEYTVHVDEAVHWSRMAGVARQETLRTSGIYQLVPESGAFDLRGLVHERGYTVALVHLQELTGIEWIDLIRFLPALSTAATAFIVWAALRSWPGAWLAAPLVALIPTSARFLGPGFFVPSGMGLAWIASILILLPREGKGLPSPGLLVLLAVWTFFIHLLSGFAALLLILCGIPFAGRSIRSVLLLVASVAIPLLAMIEAFADDVGEEVEKAGFLPVDFTIWDQVGIPFLALWAIGSALVWVREPLHARAVVRAASLASLVSLGFLSIGLLASKGAPAYALYDRWHQPFVLLAVVPVAVALLELGMLVARAAAQHARGAFFRMQKGAVTVTFSVALLTMSVVLSPALVDHMNEPFYHVISDADYARYDWAAGNLNATYPVFLDHPWKSMIYHAMSGATPVTYLRPGAAPVNNDLWLEFRRGDGISGAWLVNEDVSVVFAEELDAEMFEEVAPGVFILDVAAAQELSNLLLTEDA